VHLLVVLFQPHRGHILEIGLPDLVRGRAGFRLMDPLARPDYSPVHVQNGPNGTGGTRNMRLPLL
jgi:hypothetical protein